MLEIAEKINIDKIQLKANDIKIMPARYDSYCLYLSIEKNQQIKELQRIFYKEFPKEKYNPDDFTFHMTLHIDKDYNKVLNFQKILKENFKEFFLELEALKRELIEEAGYSIKNIKEFEKVGSHIFAEDKGYLEVIASVYIAEFDEKVTEPIEKDHTVLWVKPEEFVDKMFREWQRYIMERFIEERQLGKFYV